VSPFPLLVVRREQSLNGRILVLDHGEVVEFGTPWELIQKDGMFRELCRQSGEDAQLMEVSLSTATLTETDNQMAKLAEERKKREESNSS